MSELLIATDPNAPEASTVPESVDEKAKQLPEPVGYHILVAIPEVEDKYDSGLIKADSTMHTEEVLSTVFFVVKMGADCYKDDKRFPNGPWCKVDRKSTR